MARPTVLLGMSGGVDSSVAALLLVRQGYDVHGVTLQVWEHEDETVAPTKRWEERGCCKVGLARYVAQKLNIPHELIDSREQFRAAVIDDFVSGYASGTTPNPCVRCNERVKLKRLIEIADAKGLEYVATGHYAQIDTVQGRAILKRGADPKKDQSYFLYRIRTSWMPRILFPVGMMHKQAVWAHSEELGLPTEEMRESQEICFVSTGDYRTFLQKEIPLANNPGLFVDQNGNPLGTHQGIAYYTPGQRRGLGVSSDQRLYVQRVQPESNTVVLGPDDALLNSACTVTDLNILDPMLNEHSALVEAKLRYATPATPATIQPIGPGSLTIQFHTPQRAISPGQSAVFYRGNQVLGGGIIKTV